jgi:hypothetical protein
MSTIPVAVFTPGPEALRGIIERRERALLVVSVHVTHDEGAQALLVPEWRTTRFRARSGEHPTWEGWRLDVRELRALRRWVLAACPAHPPRAVRLLDALLSQPRCAACGGAGGTVEAPGARRARKTAPRKPEHAHP